MLRAALTVTLFPVIACVPGLPGTLDPRATGAAGAAVMCDPGCTPMAGCRDQALPTSSPISTFESLCVDQVGLVTQ